MTTFPTTVEAITPQWLTQVLRDSGVLNGAAVASFEAAPLGFGVGFMSAMRRLSLTYDGPAPGAPTSLIAKLAPSHPGAREIDGVFQFYEKETGFYREIAPSTPIRTPRAFHVGFEPDTHDFVLLLEDMAPARNGDQIDGLSVADAADALKAAAGLHARWWGDPALPTLDWLLTINSPPMRALESVYQQCWPAVVDFMGDRMTPQMRKIGDRMATRVGALLDLVAERPRTVIHGDYRADNMFFRDGQPDDRFAVVDWQVMLQGSSAFDVAYMLTGSLDVDLRRAHETELLAVHHRALSAAGVAGYSLADAAEDYRLCAMLGWCWPVVAIGSLDMDNERGVKLNTAWTQRAMTAVLDLDAGALIPDA